MGVRRGLWVILAAGILVAFTARSASACAAMSTPPSETATISGPGLSDTVNTSDSTLLSGLWLAYPTNAPAYNPGQGFRLERTRFYPDGARSVETVQYYPDAVDDRSRVEVLSIIHSEGTSRETPLDPDAVTRSNAKVTDVWYTATADLDLAMRSYHEQAMSAPMEHAVASTEYVLNRPTPIATAVATVAPAQKTIAPLQKVSTNEQGNSGILWLVLAFGSVLVVSLMGRAWAVGPARRTPRRAWYDDCPLDMR